jgi:hypothetical protein
MTAYTFSDRYFQPTGLSDRFTAEQRRPKSNSSAFGDFLSPSWQQEIGKTFLEQNPLATYLSSPTGEAFTRGGLIEAESAAQGGAMRGQTPAKRRFFQQSFQDVYNDYLSQLGGQARQGEIPTTTFRDYLATDPFTERYTKLTPDERRYYGSQGRATFAPRTRQIYY